MARVLHKARHHTIGYPAIWRSPEYRDGAEIAAGHWEPAGQIDVPYTQAENAARDIEEREGLAQAVADDKREVHRVRLAGRLRDDTITASEIRELLRLERGLI